MDKFPLDLKDRKILFQLELNARASNTAIGRAVGLSKEVVNYRIHRLQSLGLLTRFATVVDTYKLGYVKFKLYLLLHNASPENRQELIAYLTNHKNTEWVASCSGRWDIIAGYIVDDVYQFNSCLSEVLNRFSTIIASKETTATLGVPHSRKEWLLGRAEAQLPFIQQGGAKGTYHLDQTDEELLRWLVNNARMPTIDLAERLKTTPRVVAYKLRHLRSSGIILLHRPSLDLTKLGMTFAKSFLYLHNMEEKRMAQLLAYCQRNPNLTYLINCIGPWDMELEFEIDSFEAFNRAMSDLRDNFPDLINHYDFVIVTNEHKLDYFPGCHPAQS